MHDGARLAAPENRPLGCGDPATCAGHRPDANCGHGGKGGIIEHDEDLLHQV